MQKRILFLAVLSVIFTAKISAGCGLTASIGGNPSACSGSTTTLAALQTGGVAPFVYVWSTGETTQNINAVPGAYSVTITDGVSCMSVASQTVTTLSAPTATATANPTTVCPGGFAALTASGGNSYVWSMGLGSNPNIAVNPTSSTSYTVTVTGSNGCSSVAAVSVNTGMAPTINISPATNNFCIGSSMTLTASGAASYIWNYGTSTAAGATLTISSLTAGSPTVYDVLATSAAGCTATAQKVITLNTTPSNPITNTFINQCAYPGTNLNLAATGGGTYNWNWTNPSGTTGSNTNETFAIPIPSDTVVFRVTVTSAAGCTATDQIQFNPRSVPSVSITGGGAICSGESAVLRAVIADGTTVSYAWSNSLPSTETVYVVPTTNTTYRITVSNTGGCTATASTAVSVLANPPTPTIGYIEPTLMCTPNSGYNYQWFYNGFTIPNAEGYAMNPTDFGLGNGNFSVAISSANGCDAVSSTFHVFNVGVQSLNSTIFSNINVLPNPASEFVNVTFESATEADAQLILTNQFGQKLNAKNISITNGANTQSVDLSALPTGIYYIGIVSGSEIHFEKVAKN